MAHRLAAHLGGMTVAELLDRVSSRELTAWAAYEQAFGPLGPQRGDVHAAQVTTAVVNMLRDPKRRPVRLSQMILRWPGDAPAQVDPEDMALMVRQLAATLGGEISSGDPG